MAKVVVPAIRQKIFQLHLLLVSSLVAVSAMTFCLKNFHDALAVLIGGVTYLVPTACYAAKLFSNLSVQRVKRIIVIFYAGEALKCVASVGLFILLYRLFEFPLGFYLLGYSVEVLTFCIAPLLLMTQRNKVV